jgi:PKD repeat protein
MRQETSDLSLKTSFGLKGLLLIILVFFAPSVISCGEDNGQKDNIPHPKANFSYSADEANKLTIQFTNASENYASSTWDFGDNSTLSVEKNPLHVYDSDGTYPVTLTVTNSAGVTDSKKIDITVVPNNPKADFSFKRDDESGFKVIFTNLSENGTSYSWNFGDNTGTSTDKDPSYTYTAEGTYSVALTVTNSAGATDIRKVDIAIPIVSISGEPVPIGDIGEWKQIFYDDFTKDAPAGSWGSDCEPHKIVYVGEQGQQWRAYPKCYVDTYQKRPYRSDKVLSVKNGALYFYLHTVDGEPAGANPSPVIGPDGNQYQTYGRYTARFKVDRPDLHEYYVAWLLWPQSERWPEDGEEDWPEGGLAGNIGGFHHFAGPEAENPACYPSCQQGVHTDEKFTEWHTYTIEWRPGNIKYILDGKVVLDSNTGIPDTPMRWQLQTETKGNSTGVSGNLILDWVAVYKYEP